MREKVREGSTKGKGGLYKMPQIPTLPPKGPRSGVTFHYATNALDVDTKPVFARKKKAHGSNTNYF